MSTLGRLPNILSASRLLLAAGFVAAGETDTRVGIIGAAAISDFLDGWIARRAKVTSKWGALIDPIADRVFVLTVVATLLLEGRLSTIAYCILIMRDIMTAIGFLVARMVPGLKPVVFKARVLGKVVTVMQMVTLITVLVAPHLVKSMLLSLFLASMLSIADYTVALWRARKA